MSLTYRSNAGLSFVLCVLAGAVFLSAQASRPGQQPARDTPAQQTADEAKPKARIAGRVIAVDTGRARQVYRDWLALARPAAQVSPDGSRRPHWLMRPLKPSAAAFALPAADRDPA